MYKKSTLHSLNPYIPVEYAQQKRLVKQTFFCYNVIMKKLGYTG